MKQTKGCLIVMLFIILAGTLTQGASAASPNFIVILTDDQSWTGSSTRMDPDCPDSQSDYFVTPHMDRLARRGMRFSQGYAPGPFCCPTRRSLLIGQTPARHIYQTKE